MFNSTLERPGTPNPFKQTRVDRSRKLGAGLPNPRSGKAEGWVEATPSNGSDLSVADQF
jgi:hypothetical protein